jgi:uncharacterized protein DUF2877
VVSLSAVAVAEPVAALAPADGVALGSGSGAAYVDFGGFVVAITSARAPLLPNEISLAGARLPPFPTGASVSHEPGCIEAAGVVIDLRRARTWDPTVATNGERSADDVSTRCAAVLGAGDPIGLPGSDELVAAIGRRDIRGVAAAVDSLVGRGGGLTPQGDDVIVGAATALGAFAKPARMAELLRREMLAALCRPDRRRRTTSLSATLIELAASGRGAPLLGCTLNLETPENEWRRALILLRNLGHSTGRTWAAAAASVGVALARPLRSREPPPRQSGGRIGPPSKASLQRSQ